MRGQVVANLANFGGRNWGVRACSMTDKHELISRNFMKPRKAFSDQLELRRVEEMERFFLRAFSKLESSRVGMLTHESSDWLFSMIAW
jgi:hypothetical protein